MQRTYTWDVNAANLKMVQDAATGRTLTYGYDQLDRLTSASDTGTTTSACVNTLPNVPSSSQSFSIDAWGSLQQTGSFNFTQNYDSNNRVSGSGYVYDSVGNMIQDGLGNSYQYRSDGLMSSSNGATYTYDALGQRVRKDASASTEEIFFGGELIAVRDAGTGAWTDRIYGPSGVLGMVAGNQTAVPAYRLLDHLGNLTNTTDGSGNVTGATSVMPYGELVTNTSGDIYPFTEHERDSENGSDVTLYRHYSSAQGRWLSPDPSNGSYSIADPQSLNRYAYLANRPMNDVDKLGLDGDDDDDDDDGDDVDFNVWLSFDGYGGSSWITSYDGSDGGAYGFWWDPTGLGWLSDPTGPSSLGGGGASGRGNDPTGPGGPALMSGNSPSSGFSAVGSSDASAGIAAFEAGLNMLSFIPELGVPANTANGLIELARGNYRQAGLYGAAAVASIILPGTGALAKGGEAMVEAAEAAKGIAGGAQSMSAAPALANQLATESAMSAFTAEGTLSDGALASSREIIPTSQIRNPGVPSGFSKFSTQTFQSPSGDFQVHFYMNPKTLEPFYGLDYKAIFNRGGVRP